MLSKYTLLTLNTVYTFCSKIKCVPFGWKSKNSILKLYPLKGLNCYLAYLNLFFDLIASCLLFAGYQSYFKQFYKISFIRIAPGVLHCAGIGFLSILNILSFVYRKEIINFTNKFFQATKQIRKLFHYFALFI